MPPAPSRGNHRCRDRDRKQALEKATTTDLAVSVGRTALSDGDLGEVVEARRGAGVERAAVFLVALVAVERRAGLDRRRAGDSGRRRRGCRADAFCSTHTHTPTRWRSSEK